MKKGYWRIFAFGKKYRCMRIPPIIRCKDKYKIRFLQNVPFYFLVFNHILPVNRTVAGDYSNNNSKYTTQIILYYF